MIFQNIRTKPRTSASNNLEDKTLPSCCNCQPPPVAGPSLQPGVSASKPTISANDPSTIPPTTTLRYTASITRTSSNRTKTSTITTYTSSKFLPFSATECVSPTTGRVPQPRLCTGSELAGEPLASATEDIPAQFLPCTLPKLLCAILYPNVLQGSQIDGNKI